MASKRSPLFWLRIAVVLVVLAWFWVAPHRTWQHFLAALDNGSVADLEQAVDLPRLRGYLREDISDAVRHNPGKLGEAKLPSDDVLSSLVEAASSPNGLQATVASFGYQGARSLIGEDAPEISFHFRSPILVDVWMHAKGTPVGETGLFTLQLTSSGWKLTRIRTFWLAGKQT